MHISTYKVKIVHDPKRKQSSFEFQTSSSNSLSFCRHHAPHLPLYGRPTPTCSGREAQANGWQFKSLVTDPCCNGSNEAADAITSINCDIWLIMARAEHKHMHTYAHTHTQIFPCICNRFFPLGPGWLSNSQVIRISWEFCWWCMYTMYPKNLSFP